MNPVERDIRGYFGIAPEDSILEHYGTKRHSGRYPWGSGENPYQRSGDFLSRVEELKKSGMKEKDILQTINDSLPEEYKMGATEFRMAQRRAIHERQQLKYDRARALSQDGLGPTEIGREMGLSESTVRSMLKNDKPDKYTRTKEIAETLRKEVDKKGMIDVSEGTNLVLGVSEGDLDDAIFVLEAEHGYQRYGVGIRQPTNINQQTNITVLAKPEYDQKYAYQHQNEIQSLGEYHSEDGGETFKKLQRPSSMSSDRVYIRYGDEGGLDKDGVIEIRRGVADLNLGKSHYAQVRIMVDDSHYLKGMAVYSDDIPEGYDVVFNTNKKSGTPKMKVLKPIKDDPDNPFGASIKANGQSTYIGEDGKEHLSPINKLKEEGDWDTMAKNLSSQFLSKQPLKLLKQQLDLTVADRKAEYERKRIKKRLITKQYLIIPRGAAKTMYDAFIQSYFLTVDVSTTQQCTTAPTMKQAEEVLSPIRTALARSKGPLLKFMTEGSLQNTTGAKSDRVKLASTKKGIENFLTNSLLEVRPMTIDKLQGRRDRVATVDEWLSCDIREDPISALEQGASKNEDYLIVATSSEGTVRNGCGDTIKMELMDILKGEYINPHVSIWYYKLDSIDEVTNPDMWLKANPNLGQTVSYETYQLDVERAEKAPGSRNDILAKRFNIPMEGYTYFFPYEETLPHRHRDYWQMPCALGADLSQGDDFCAFTFLFPMANGFFGVKTRDYITSYTLSKLPQAMRQKYDQFMQEGTLQVFDGTVLDMMQVYDDLDNFIQQNDYDVRCFGYDPYNAKDFVERWCTENAPFGVEKVIQGAKTESVPLGELKKLSEQRKLLFDEALMQFAMGNCIALEDTNGNRKLLKRRSDQKIDAVAAMMDAYIAWKLNREAFE